MQTVNSSGNDSITVSELGVNATNNIALYEFDNFDRLTKITQGNTIIENVYSGDGKNISRTTNGETEHYLYDGNTIILELDSENNQIARNVFGRSIIRRLVDDLDMYYRFDGLGNVMNTYDDEMNLVSYEYDEFGGLFYEVDPTESIDNPYRYRGYEYVKEADLYDLNARYYDAKIARFLSPDPYYNLGNRIIGLYEINVPNAYSIMQANNLFAYCHCF